MSTPTLNATLAFFGPDSGTGLQTTEYRQQESSARQVAPAALQEQSQPSPPVKPDEDSTPNEGSSVNLEIAALQAQIAEERKRILQEHRERVKEVKMRGQVLRGRPEKSPL